MGDEYSDSEKEGVIWNFDDAESKLIFTMKMSFISYRDSWDLENAFWSLWRLLSEIEPLFEENDRGKLNNNFNEIINKRKEKTEFINLTEEEKSEIAVMLNNFYRSLCLDAVEQNYYFRKKKQYLGL